VLASVYQLQAALSSGRRQLPELHPLAVPEELQRPRGGVAH